MWVYRGMSVPLNVFDFTVSRHRDGPVEFLKDFNGTLLGDCYSGFQGIAVRSDGAIMRAACNAHARRKLLEALDAYPREASLLLGMYQQLYDIETRGKTLSVDKERPTILPWPLFGPILAAAAPCRCLVRGRSVSAGCSLSDASRGDRSGHDSAPRRPG